VNSDIGFMEMEFRQVSPEHVRCYLFLRANGRFLVLKLASFSVNGALGEKRGSKRRDESIGSVIS